jgi:peptide/nickel transport system substrate-binding protein
VLRLETGQSDFLPSEVRPEDYAALKRAADTGRVRLVDLGVGLDTNFLWFNLRPDRKGAAWLAETNLRRAISHAVDRQQFADAVFLGAAVPVHGPVTPGNKRWYAPEAPQYAHDPARARALLAEIGLTDPDGDGMLADRAGQPARFPLLTQKGNTARERGAVVLQETLRRVGLAVDVVPLEVGALVTRIMAGDYDAAYFGFNVSDADPAASLGFWLSAGPFHLWNPGQAKPATGWEARIDDLMRQQVSAAEFGDRKRLFDEVQHVFGGEVPAICFVAPRIYVAMSSRVANATPGPLQPQILWNAEMLAAAPAAMTRR